jgi:hypothetical protein
VKVPVSNVLGHHESVAKKLRPGLAWPTKASTIAAALGPIADQIHVAWMTWERRATNPLQASWEPRDAPVIGGIAGRGATLWVGPVDRSDLDVIRRAVDETILGAATRWFIEALAAGEAWQSSRHERRWSVAPDGTVTTHDDHGMHIVDRERG